MYKVASQAGVIHSQNPGFHPRSRPAGDAQQPSLPFFQLLDDANGAPPLSPKDVCERPSAAQTSQPAASGNTQQQPAQQLANSEPTQQSAVVASVLPVDEAEKIDTTSAEGIAAAFPDDQTDPAKASGDAATTMAIVLANAAQATPEQQVPAVVIAPVTPVETQPSPEQTAAPSVTAPATPSEPQPAAGKSIPPAITAPASPLETQSAPEQKMAAAATAPVSSSEGQSAASQPAAAAVTVPGSEGQSKPTPNSDGQSASQQPTTAAATVPQTQPAGERPSTATGDATAIPAQTQHTPAGAAGVQPVGLDNPATVSAAGPQPQTPPKLTAEQDRKTAPAKPTGSPIDKSQTADATQDSDPAATTNGTPATNAGLAANEEHRNGQADSPPESKKEHAAITAAASRVGLQNSEALSTPHTETHAADIAQAGKTSDGVQLLTMQQPADRFATAASPAAQSASTQDAAAAAVPLAGLAVEIAARAQAGRNRFEIRLDPPELGRIDVRLDIDRSGHVTSRLTVERVETLDALRRDAGDLERALQQAGLKTADNGLQFTLRDQSFAGRDQSFPTTAAARVVVPGPELATLDSSPASYGRIQRPGGGIDIRV